jgi:hypothetical protein
MLRFRWYSILCPACRKTIDILPPESIVAENLGLAHRCGNCRRWLAVSVSTRGIRRELDVRLIENGQDHSGPDPLRRFSFD